jgi:hypothetical protein
MEAPLLMQAAVPALAPSARAARSIARRAPTAAVARSALSAGRSLSGVAVPLRAAVAAPRRCRASAQRVRATLATPPAVSAEDDESPRFKAWESSFANRHRRTDIKRIMILGAGPIVIGQARQGGGGAARGLAATFGV